MVWIGRWRWCVAVMVLAGCGPAATMSDDGEDSGGSSSAGTDEVCAEALDADSPDFATLVHVINGTDSTLFVGYEALGIPEVFRLTRLADGETVLWHGQHCAPTCEEVSLDMCPDCDPIAPGATIRLEAGATHTVEWSGSLFYTGEYPAACGTTMCASMCDQRLDPAAGDYRFDVVASTECVGEQCECAEESPACVVRLPEQATPTHTASVEVTLPAASVSITLEAP